MVPTLVSKTTYWQSVRQAIETLTVRGRAVANTSVRGVAFWLAIALPWLLLGLSIGGSIGRHPRVFGGLLVAALLFAVVGHDYARER
jgi:hypothetical protein